MMAYRVIIPRPVRKQLDKLPRDIRIRLLQRIALLKENPRPLGAAKLKGYEYEYRIRVGSYRVRYEVREPENVVLLLHCKHRKDAYRN